MYEEESYEKVLYEYQAKSGIVFRVTTKGIVKMIDDKIHDIIYEGEPLKIIDYKDHVIIRFIGQTILHSKINFCDIRYLELKHIYYEGIMYRFRSLDFEKYYLAAYSENACLINKVHIPVEDFKMMTTRELLVKYLKSVDKVFDRNLMGQGITVYRKYWNPISALGLIRDRLCDLMIIAQND